jgi:PelA/Pel-15E family pectate lyase
MAAWRWGWMGLWALGAVSLATAAPTWSTILRQPAGWYGSAEALAVARTVQRYQEDVGGWAKNTDMTVPPAAGWRSDGATIDNGATTTQLWLLARVAAEQPAAEDVRASVRRGLNYLLAAQYENGGWPQYYPLRRGYYSHITYNDDAMVNVLQVLQAVADGRPPFSWVEAARRETAAMAVARGVECILRTQVRVDEQLTAWCAQHDAVTLAPAPARAFEPISLSGAETVSILEFLLTLPDPSPAVVTAIEAGVAWLQAVRLDGWKISTPPLPGGRRDQVLEPEAGGVVWARFYELGSNRPIFLGRDLVVRYSLAEVEAERRSGYRYYGTWANELLTESYPAWRAARRSLVTSSP